MEFLVDLPFTDRYWGAIPSLLYFEKTMKRHSLLAALFCVLFLSCEKENPVAITDGIVYAELTARYDKSINKTSGTAYFWEGQKSGRRLIFNGGAKLSFLDLPMDYRTSDFSYIKDVDGYRTPAEFKFTDINNRTFTNTISVNIVDFPAAAVLDTIDSSVPLTIAWFGLPLENGENVSLRIESVSAKQDVFGSTSVTFSTANFAALASLKNTVVKLSLERFKVLPLSQDLGGGGIFTAQYLAQSKSVYLK